MRERETHSKSFSEKKREWVKIDRDTEWESQDDVIFVAKTKIHAPNDQYNWCIIMCKANFSVSVYSAKLQQQNKKISLNLILVRQMCICIGWGEWRSHCLVFPFKTLSSDAHSAYFHIFFYLSIKCYFYNRALTANHFRLSVSLFTWSYRSQSSHRAAYVWHLRVWPLR